VLKIAGPSQRNAFIEFKKGSETKPLLTSPDISSAVATTANAKSTEQKKAKKGKDIYIDTPVRLLGFTNEIGAAISPVIGPVGELISYAPALTYIFMDTRDKYKRGDDNSYEKPSAKNGTKQFVFQSFASVILPTGIVKTSQAFAEKTIDSKHMQGAKETVTNFIQSKPLLAKIINKFADKPDIGVAKKGIVKFALGFQKALKVVTVFPLFFKDTGPKSGLKNLALVAVGLTTLSLAIKPIDKFTEKIIMKNIFKDTDRKNATVTA
jgi:hypothetical protein